MAVDEKNFRSSYYEKVGFRSVEEKKSLDILLKDNPLDRLKLKQFCLRFSVPSFYRTVLWKFLLEITPKFSENSEFVWDQRAQTYEDLLRSAKVLKLTNEDTPKPTLFLLLWLLETGNVRYDIKLQLDDPNFKNLVAISRTLSEMIIGDVDVYWVSRGIYSIAFAVKENTHKLIDATRTILEKEDSLLFNHFQKLAAFQIIPLETYFHCLFAGVLHESSLVKIWDKLIGGSLKILSFVAVVIFTTLRRSMLGCSTAEQISAETKGINDETSDVICNKSIETWQQYGSPLMPTDSRKD